MKIQKLVLIFSFFLPIGLFGCEASAAAEHIFKIKQLEIELISLKTDYDFRAELKTSNTRLLAVNREHLDQVQAKIAIINLELDRLRLLSREK